MDYIYLHLSNVSKRMHMYNIVRGMLIQCSVHVCTLIIYILTLRFMPASITTSRFCYKFVLFFPQFLSLLHTFLVFLFFAFSFYLFISFFIYIFCYSYMMYIHAYAYMNACVFVLLCYGLVME